MQSVHSPSTIVMQDHLQVNFAWACTMPGIVTHVHPTAYKYSRAITLSVLRALLPIFWGHLRGQFTRLFFSHPGQHQPSNVLLLQSCQHSCCMCRRRRPCKHMLSLRQIMPIRPISELSFEDQSLPASSDQMAHEADYGIVPVESWRMGWLPPWWPNFSLKVLPPHAWPRIWWPMQIPKMGCFPSRLLVVSTAYGRADGSPCARFTSA